MTEQKLTKGWRKIRLVDLSESISAGGTPRRSKKECWKNGSIPWLKISDMKKRNISETDEKITKEGLKNSSAKIFPKGTIVYSIFATLGSIGILDIESATNQAIAGIIPKNDIVNTKYLYYCLKTERNKIIAKRSHATQDNLNLSILKNHEISIPPLDDQNKIVSLLEKTEKAKELRKKADKLTEDLLKSVFLKMFKENLKFETKKIGDICNIQSGGTPSRTKKEYWSNGKIPWLGSTVCKDSYVNKSDQFITENGFKNSSAKIFKKGTILVALVGATIGKTAYLNFEAATNQNIAGIYPKEETDLNFEYLFYSIKSLYYRFMSLSNDKFKMANLTFVRNLEIQIPPISLQKRFASIVKEVESVKEQQKESRTQIDNLFNSLMQKAFRGEIG